MADSFFGFDTSVSNLNDDEGGGGPSEDEYDALNDETFGQDSDSYDWEVEHEQLAERLENSRPSRHAGLDHSASLEASLSQLVLDDNETPQHSFSSSVWRHDAPFPAVPTQPAPTLKNVCTVEELERQIRQNQQQQAFSTQNYFPPRFPVILQRPPGLQAPVPLPFAPQQSIVMGQLNQPLNKILGQNNQLNQMSQTSLLHNQMGQNMNQMGQNVNQMGQNVNQMGQNMNQMGQNVNQMGQNVNQMGQNVNQLGNINQFMQNANQMGNQFQNQLGQNNMMGLTQNMQVHQMGQSSQLLQNQMGPNMNQMGQNMNQMGPSMNQMGQTMNQMSQNMNQMGQNVNQMGQNVNQMMPNGNQYNPGMNQFPHMMGQPRMMAPPPGMSMPRQNFSPNVGQYNHTFRGPTIAKPSMNDQQPTNQQLNQQPMNQQPMNQQPMHPQPSIQQNMLMNQQMHQMKNSTPMNHKPVPSNHMNQPIGPSNHMNQPIGPSNQMNQSPQKSHQKVQNQNRLEQNRLDQNRSDQNRQENRSDQKVQKSRIYNNSKNMTSQNLVQLIQNTHPMLQYNNTTYHNANHHPMLNNRSSLFNSNQFVNNHMFNNQRLNGSFSNNNRQSLNGSDGSGSDCDEYAGLMSSREKQWLVNIQLLQLSTGTPYIHDFYYTVFLERQASKEKEGVKEAHKANQQNHPFYSGAVTKQETHTHTRERHNSNRHNSTSEDGTAPRTYVPAQFENSLGKLQCGSVTAPRKIIDLEVVAGEPSSQRVSRAPSVASTTTEAPREVKRTKQLLLDIEALYLILLRLEELNDPLAISNALILKEREEKQKQLEQAQKEALENDQEEDSNVFLRNIESVQRRPKQDSPKSESIDKRQVVNLAVNQKPAPVKNLLDEDKDDLVNKMFLGLLHSDRLQQILVVRKGKALVARFLCRVSSSHARLRALWSRVLRALPSAARRDDGSLAALATHYRKYIQNTTGWSAILESSSLLSEALDPARTPHALTTSFTLSCVCALVEKASILSNTPEATSNERQWYKFLKTLSRALKNTTLNVARPLQKLPESKMMSHLKQLESRSTIEILQRGKSAAEYADLSKADISELLVKNLC